MAHPVSTSEARAALTRTVARFRAEGTAAEPVVFGSHRKPEAVVMPYETYEALLALAEEVAIARTVAERDARDTGARYTLEEVAQRLGVDADDL